MSHPAIKANCGADGVGTEIFWGLDESSARTFVDLFDVRDVEDLHVVSQGRIAENLKEPWLNAYYEPVTFDNVCEEDGFWTASDFSYRLSTNLGPDSGALYEFNGDAADSANQRRMYTAAIEKGFQNWQGPNRFYFGALGSFVKAAKAAAGSPASDAASAASAKDVQAFMTALQESFSSCGKKEDLMKKDGLAALDVLFGGMAPVSVSDAVLDGALAAVAAKDKTEEPFTQFVHVIHHYNEARNAFDKAIEARKKNPTADIKQHIDEIKKNLDVCYAVIPTSEILRKMDGSAAAEAAEKIRDASRLMDLKALLTGTPSTKEERARFDAYAEQIQERARMSAEEGTVAIKYGLLYTMLDPRRRELLTIFTQRVADLQKEAAKLSASLCPKNEVREEKGGCTPCPSPWLVPNESQTGCITTEQSCAPIGGVPNKDRSRCDCVEPKSVWDAGAEQCVAAASGPKRELEPKPGSTKTTGTGSAKAGCPPEPLRPSDFNIPEKKAAYMKAKAACAN